MPTQDIPLAELSGHERNYNQHSDAQIAKIAKSLKTFGQVRSIVTWRNTILAGHGVVLAARSLGWETIRADVQDHLTEAQALAYVVADNELARQSDPDQAQLAAILEELQAKEPLLVEAAGYTAQELDQLLAQVASGFAPNDPNAEWVGMPEFEQEDLSALQSIHVNFRSREDVEDFAQLIGQRLSDKTRSIWYPEAERIDMVSELYRDEA